MSWQNLAALLIGSAVAVIGGLHNVAGLLALGGTIVGGILGSVVPRHSQWHPPIEPPPPPPTQPRRRATRRVLTPASLDQTMRNRLPRSGVDIDGSKPL